ncbi:unnamed protein product, partial [Mycena citricolor]
FATTCYKWHKQVSGTVLSTTLPIPQPPRQQLARCRQLDLPSPRHFMGSPRRNPSDLVSRLKGPSPLPVQRGGQQPKMRSSSISAIPTHYYVLFAIYEPCLTTIGFLGALIDPKATHDSQAPWPKCVRISGCMRTYRA